MKQPLYYKRSPELLDLISLSPSERKRDLQSIFKRDIEENPDFKFRSWQYIL